MKNYPLIRTFTVFSIFAFILTGFILSFIISGHIKTDKLDNLQELARITVRTVTRIHLTENDFTQIIPAAREARIRSDIINFLPEYNIGFITLINSTGVVIMSSDPALVGKQGWRDANIDAIIRGSKPFIITDKTDMLTDEMDITIYEPVTLDGDIKGLFILQLSDQIIKAHVNEIIKAVAWTLAGGLLLLFVMLIGIMLRASRSLIKQNEELVIQKSKLEEAFKKLDDSYKSTMLSLSNAVDVRDPYTAGHSSRVARISLLIAQKLGMTKEMQNTLECAALFHDIGKLGVAESILLKNGKLTDEEFEAIMRHPDIGISILENVRFLKDALPIIRYHHEKFSGGGYPGNISREEIPLGARIIAIADTYDAMTSDRPYRKSLGHAAAVYEIHKNKGIQFDDRLVDVFMDIENEVKNI